MTFKKQNKEQEKQNKDQEKDVLELFNEFEIPVEKTKDVVVDNLYILFNELHTQLSQIDKRKTALYLDRLCKQFTNLTYQQLQTYFNEPDVFKFASDHLKSAFYLFLLNLKFAIVADFNKFTEMTSQNAYRNSISVVNFAKLFNSNHRLFFTKDDIEYYVDRNANLYTIKKVLKNDK